MKFDMTPPNYAFTQVNPLPFDIPNLIPIKGIKHVNVFYVILVYIAYVCLFFAFFGAYRAFLAIRGVVLAKVAQRGARPVFQPSEAVAGAEIAATSADDGVTDETAPADGAEAEAATAETE